MNIIEEAMAREQAFECVVCPEPAESCLAIHPCEHSIRAAIEHAVRRCIKVADDYFAEQEGTSYDVVNVMLRAAGLPEETDE